MTWEVILTALLAGLAAGGITTMLRLPAANRRATARAAAIRQPQRTAPSTSTPTRKAAPMTTPQSPGLSTPATRADNPDLPAGYDDPDSPWFVPDQLRKHFRADPVRDAELLTPAQQREWTRQDAYDREYERLEQQWSNKLGDPRARHVERFPVGAPPGQRTEIVRHFNPLFEPPVTPDPSGVPERLHAARLGDAATSLRDTQRAAEDTASWSATHTCAVCGQVLASVQPRSAGRAGTMQACPECAAATARAADAAADAQVIAADGRTRAQAAAAYLANPRPPTPPPPAHPAVARQTRRKMFVCGPCRRGEHIGGIHRCDTPGGLDRCECDCQWPGAGSQLAAGALT